MQDIKFKTRNLLFPFSLFVYKYDYKNYQIYNRRVLETDENLSNFPLVGGKGKGASKSSLMRRGRKC